jgi:hypothetical protein
MLCSDLTRLAFAWMQEGLEAGLPGHAPMAGGPGRWGCPDIRVCIELD